MKFKCIAANERLQYQPGIVAIEQIASYPLGNDFFKIDHGADYFAFFDRLGDVYYYLGLDGDRAIAVGAGVLREVPNRPRELPHPAWYLCDLKVHPDYRGFQLPLRLLGYAIQSNTAGCDRGYAISMNPGDGSPNRVVRLLQRFSPVPFRCTATLEIYALDAATMHSVASVLVEYRGPISYLSLQGIKDLKLQSTGEILPLLHVQFGSQAQQGTAMPQVGSTHMFCVPSHDSLALTLAERGIYPMATASVISHGMDDCDWRFILTSDI